ncbi:MAG: hypothetical protein ACOH2B_12150 [Burkholderiaceae bacterium]
MMRLRYLCDLLNLPQLQHSHAPIKRITTDYLGAEDRIRLTAALQDVLPAVFWLTQCLLHSIVPVLLQWVDRQEQGQWQQEQQQ